VPIIRFADKGNGVATSAKTLIDYIGSTIPRGDRSRLKSNRNTELLVEANLPGAFFKKKPQQLRIIERGKATG
jgi:hypothetical protein